MKTIEIDPIEFDCLMATLEKQQKEIIKLKNYLDFVEPKKIFKNKQHKNIDLTIPVSNWNVQHFIRYFLHLYNKAYGEVYLMESTASWKIGAFKITHFWQRHPELTKIQYKDFLEYLFETVQENYKLKLGLITNDMQLKNYKEYCIRQNKTVYNKENEEGFNKVDDSLPEIKENTTETVAKLKKTFGLKDCGQDF